MKRLSILKIENPGIRFQEMAESVFERVDHMLSHGPFVEKRLEAARAATDTVRIHADLGIVDDLVAGFPAFPAIIGVGHEKEIARVEAAQLVP